MLPDDVRAVLETAAADDDPEQIVQRARRLELPPASYTAPGRPSVIRTPDGGRIYIHIHDAEYMRRLRGFRAALAAAHPDAGGSAHTFRRAVNARNAWRNREARWYARYGLLPPDGYTTTQTRAIAARNRRALLSRNPELATED